MSIVPILSAWEVMRRLKRAGFQLRYTKGSHYFFFNAITDRWTSVPLHGRKDIGRKLLQKILRQAGLSIEEFIEL